MRLNNFVVLELALNPASQRRVWKKRFANQIHPLNIFPPLKVHFQTCCHLSTITSNLQMNGSLLFLLFTKLTWNHNICQALLRLLLLQASEQIPCYNQGQSALLVGSSAAFSSGLAWGFPWWLPANLSRTADTSHHTMSIILRRYATFESLLVVKGADSGRNSLFVSCAWRERGKAEDEGNYIYYRDLFIFVYKKGNIYLHQPNVTFKLTK